jgi:hypothetical protein
VPTQPKPVTPAQLPSKCCWSPQADRITMIACCSPTEATLVESESDRFISWYAIR